MKAVGKYVVVKQKVSESKSAGGIIMDVKPKNFPVGEVVSIGSGVTIDICEGETVYFTEVAHTQPSGSDVLMVVHENSIIASE